MVLVGGCCSRQVLIAMNIEYLHEGVASARTAGAGRPGGAECLQLNILMRSPGTAPTRAFDPFVTQRLGPYLAPTRYLHPLVRWGVGMARGVAMQLRCKANALRPEHPAPAQGGLLVMCTPPPTWPCQPHGRLWPLLSPHVSTKRQLAVHLPLPTITVAVQPFCPCPPGLESPRGPQALDCP